MERELKAWSGSEQTAKAPVPEAVAHPGKVRTVGITGASGYVGSVLRRAFDDSGWQTVAMVRAPGPAETAARHFDLRDDPHSSELSVGLDVIVHCAWDLRVTGRNAMWDINVGGSRRLFESVGNDCRVIVVSSMSAYPGTRQLYGQAKLAVERLALERGYLVVRPGLVYGRNARGMAGALTRLARAPIVPVIAGPTRQFPVHEDDLAAAIVGVAAHPEPIAVPIGVAQLEPLDFGGLLRALGGRGTGPRTLSIPWQLPFGVLRAAERLSITLPFRADSMLGLVRAAPCVPNPEVLAALGVSLRVLVDPRSKP
jgi:nucleoside-diphosphate-sugar epimerase